MKKNILSIFSLFLFSITLYAENITKESFYIDSICYVPSTCKNGVQDAGETGRDCGGISCNICPIADTGQVVAIIDGCSWMSDSNLLYNGGAAWLLNGFSKDTTGRSIKIGVTPGSITVGVHRTLSIGEVSVYGINHTGLVLGEVYVTLIDTSAKKMSGTFYFYSRYGTDTIHVSSGSFNKIYYGPNNTGVNDFNSQRSFIIYPNPSTNKFTISFSKELSNALGGTSLKIFNMMGEEVYATTVNNRQETINTNLSSGIYFVQVRDEERQWVQKIVVE